MPTAGFICKVKICANFARCHELTHFNCIDTLVSFVKFSLGTEKGLKT